MSLKTPFGNGPRFRPHTDSGVFTRVGADMLNWAWEEVQRIERRANLSSHLTTGVHVQTLPDGSLAREWMPKEDPSNAGDLLIQGSSAGTGPMYAINSSGDAVYVGSGIPPLIPTTWSAPKTPGLSVAADSTWRTLVMRLGTTTYQPGAITISSSTGAISVAATSADIEDPTLSTSGGLSRYSARTTNGLDVGAKVRIDTADDATSAGDYELVTVSNATYSTSGTVASNPPSDVTDAPFSIAGSYMATEPASAADTDIYQRVVPSFELVPRTIAPASGDIALADVWYDGSDMRFADRRRQNLLRHKSEDGLQSRAYMLSPMVTPTEDIATVSVTAKRYEWNPSNVTLGAGDHAICTRRDRGSMLVAHRNQTQINMLSFDEHLGGFTAIASAVASGVSGPALLHCPSAAADSQHILFYVDTGVLKRKVCTDDGTTWGAAATVVDPTAVDASDTAANPHALLLASGRILVAFEYYDDSAGVTNIRTVYSDDYGTTWTTNSNAGYAIWTEPSSGDAFDPCLAQDPITGRLWLAFHNDSAEVRLVYSATLTGISAFTGLSTASTTGLLIQCENNAYGPALWVAPNGQVFVVFQEFVVGGGTPTNGYTDLIVGGVIYDGTDPVQTVGYTMQTVEVASGALSTSARLRAAVAQTRSGRILLGYQDPNNSTSYDVFNVGHLIATTQPFGNHGFMP